MHGGGNRIYGLHVIITDCLQNVKYLTIFEDFVAQGQGQGLVVREQGHGQGLEVHGQGQGLVNWSSRSRTTTQLTVTTKHFKTYIIISE